MPDATTATESLADYIRAENAKEREASGLDGHGPDLPEAEPLTAAETASSAGEVTETEPATTVEAEPEPVKAESGERNADGTFKAKRDKVQERIDKAIKAQRDAERRAEAAEARAREFENKGKPETAAKLETKPADDDEPTLDKFIAEHPDHPDPISGFTRQAAIWGAKKALAEKDAADRASREQTAYQTRVQEIDAAGREQFPDYAEVMSSEFASTFRFPQYFVEAIHSSEQAPALLHYLGTHETEARALAAKSPASALVELGSIAARLSPAENGSGGRTVPHSKAKPLTKPLRGSTPSAPSAVTLDPDKTPFNTWFKTMNAAERRERA